MNQTIFPTANALANGAAQFFVQQVRSAVAKRGAAYVAMSGGSTPQQMNRQLAAAPLRQQVPWAQLHLFWVDERCVPADHPDSNYQMAHQTLLAHVPIPAAQIYRMPGELSPVAGAAAYQNRLQQVFKEHPPRFDLILLGMGPDGHTASLFPGSPLLNHPQTWVAPVVDSPKPPPTRLTLTLPVINAARHVLFLVGGAAKKGTLQTIFAATPIDNPLPASLVQPTAGTLHWFIDEAAAP